MYRMSLLALALLAGCPKQRPLNETLGQTHVSPDDVVKRPVAAKPDPALPFRQAFRNPGGMWMPQQMTLPKHVETFRQLGVEIPAATLAKPLSAPLAAIVHLPGCTGSFVSKDGLIVTNHHCVQQSLQYASTEADNLVENGFVAATRADERPAGPAVRVQVVNAFRDVTEDMRKGLDAIRDPAARTDESEQREKALVAACEKDRPAIRCNVASYFRGGQYLLIENLELRDVRIVHAPPRGIGNYGGEIDNWAWPRHTGDYAFYRAYVGKDGQPADQFDKDGKLNDNVPYQPKHHLTIATQGLKPADFVMVAGYPGRTNRVRTSLETHHDVEWSYPYLIEHSKQRYAILDGLVKAGGETAIKATVAKQGVQNGLEKSEGVLKGMTAGGMLAQKDALDAAVKEWAAGVDRDEYKTAIDKLESLLAAKHRTARVDYDRSAAFSGSRLMTTALSLTRWAEERAKPDAAREQGYQERDLVRAKAATKTLTKSFDATIDRAVFRLALTRALALPEAQRPWLATLLDAKKGTKLDEAFVEKTLDAWYKAPAIVDEAVRLELLDKGTMKEIKASKDPFVMAAQRIWATYKAEEKKDDARAGELMLVAPLYAEAMRLMLGGVLAPDANSTLRVTYGTVRNTTSEPPFTTASQIPAKNTGKDPFDAPAAALEAIKAKKYGTYADAALGGELPVDYVTDVDTTGGNSGSPTLNARGEFVGLAFDGSIEGLAADVVYNPDTNRSIHVDQRYILWVMDVVVNADHLLREMGVTPQFK